MEVEVEYQFKSFNIDEDQNYSKVEQCIKILIKKEGYIKYSVDKKVFTGDGGSFLGILYEVNIKAKNERKENNLFLKIITPGEQMTIVSLSDAYRKELFFYCELSKVFEELQNEVNLPIEERFKTVKCYDESTANVIIFDNMKVKGYSTIFRMDTLSLDYAELAVKTLAKFHALSFVMENKKPAYYEKNIKTISQPFTFNNDFNVLFQNVCILAMNFLDEVGRQKVEDLMPLFLEKYEKHISNKTTRAVLCHGDFRPSNLLIKKENGAIKDLIPIDYQLIYHGCPVMDLIYLLFPATDRAFRKAHLTHLKEVYYNELRSFLKHFDLDVGTIYPKEEFETHFKERLEYGVLISLNLLPFTMARVDDLPELTGDVTSISYNVDIKYKDRIRGLISDFIEMGCL